MTARPDIDPLQPLVADEDDWFATPPVEPSDAPGETAWQDEPEEPPPPADGLGRRQAAVVLAVVVAVALGAAGILLARSLTGSDSSNSTAATAASTAAVSTTPAASTSVATTSASTTPAPTTPGSTTATTAAVPTDAVLRAGATGSAVTALQQTLTDIGFAPGTADGNYGTATTQAVAAFQKANGLPVDGIAGAETIAAINAQLASG